MFMKRIAELVMMAAAQPKPVGQIEWTTPGTYYWTVPDNVYSISAVLVGGGGAGGVAVSDVGGRSAPGPGLRYAVTIPVTPGETLTVIIGAGGAARAALSSTTPSTGGDTRIQRNGVDLLWAQGAQTTTGGAGSPFGGNIGGGNGGAGGKYSGTSEGLFNAGAGGAGGYAGDGGGSGGNAGAGGGGGGGRRSDISPRGGLGGGVGIRGQGADGAGGAGDLGNGGNGSAATGPVCGRSSGSATQGNASVAGTPGGARFIYGEGRFYPSTRTADE